MQQIDIPANIDDENFSPEIDRKFLTQIKQRFLELNSARLERAHSVMSDRQQQFLELLPLLFHVNHPMLPGYVSRATPCGIHNFTPSKELLRTAKIVARSYNYQRDVGEKKNAIDALFLMGSLGSIAQSDTSDLDVWVCHRSDIASDALQELNEKCQLLARWASDMVRIDTHFFLMDSEKFQQGQQLLLTSEASGSAQHFLLLDEFYRSALWLAGKLPLWWFVPVEREKYYQEYAQLLLRKRFLRASDYLDFGGLPKIPVNEFIGAGIWQVYKGIEAPHKSVLKLLLLESYAQEEFSEPVSLQLKRSVYDNEMDVDEQDAYVLIYRRLENYLKNQAQESRLGLQTGMSAASRLALVQRCFYFKAGRRLSRSLKNATQNWQIKLLHKLVSEWGWRPADLHLLDNRAYWKAPHVIAERDLLANELLQGYRMLMDMANRSSDHRDLADLQDHAAISHGELLILGRKLHAAFEHKAGKIDAINPGISFDLAESSLCFIKSSESREAGEIGTGLWQVFRGSQQDILLRTQPVEPIKHGRHFLELLLWCYLNGILQFSTRFDVVSKDFSQNTNQRSQLWQMIQSWLPLPLPKPAHENFLTQTFANRLLILCNLGVEPQAELHKKGLQMLSSQGDALGFSGFRDNLVLTLDVVQVNSWGEIQCRHFDRDALVNCLIYYLRLIAAQKTRQFPSIKMGCFSVGQGAAIEHRLLELWRAVMSCFYSESGSPNARFVFEMGNEILMLQLAQQQPLLQRFKSYEKFIEKLQQPVKQLSPIVLDNYAIRDKPLRLFLEPMRAPGYKIFYRVEHPQSAQQSKAQVTIADDKGAIYCVDLPYLNATYLLRPLLRFLASVAERQSCEADEINTPAVKSNQSLSVPLFECQSYEYTVDTKNISHYLEPRTLSKEQLPNHYLALKALVEVWEEDQHCVRFYSEGKEFSQLLLGDKLYESVAQFILSRRLMSDVHSHSVDFYAVYITDLDLSLCRDQLAPQTGLQLNHYLHIKFQLEAKINDALHQLIVRIK